MHGRPLTAWLAVVACLAACAGPAAAIASDFEHPASNDTSQQFVPGANIQRQDTPNDPVYDQAEPDTQHGHTSSNFFDERFDLFGFPSELTPTAVYKDGPNAGRWKIDPGTKVAPEDLAPTTDPYGFAAVLPERIHYSESRWLVGSPTPPHGSQAETGDLQIGTAKSTIVHMNWSLLSLITRRT